VQLQPQLVELEPVVEGIQLLVVLLEPVVCLGAVQVPTVPLLVQQVQLVRVVSALVAAELVLRLAVHLVHPVLAEPVLLFFAGKGHDHE